MMIQEAFAGEIKDFAANASVSEAALPSLNLCSSRTTTNSSTGNAAAPTAENNQLRCPRCDSSNTKFCYYNNYNLTQPRHICKACRRYWTKGGALRNVPIGGGCRRNHKNSYIPSTPLGKPSSSPAPGKFNSINVTGHINENRALRFHSGFDQQHLLPLNPDISSGASPQTSHLLALLRSIPNPNPTSDSFKVKDGDQGFIFGSEMRLDQQRDVGSIGIDLLKNNNQNQQQNCCTVQSPKVSDQLLYQRLGVESLANYSFDNSQAVDMNSNSSTAILESAPVTGLFRGWIYWQEMVDIFNYK